MGTCELQNLTGLNDLIARANGANEPLIVFDGEDECLVAMRPAVLERILFDGDLLNCERRETLHL